MAGFKDFFLGTPERTEQFSGFTPQNQESFNELISSILGQFKGGGADFEPIARQAQDRFAQQTVPGIMERLTGMGGQRSSALGQTLGQAGANLDSSLAAQQSGHNLQRMGQLQGLLGQGKQETSIRDRQPGILESLFSQLVPAGGQALGSYLGRPQTQYNIGQSGGGQQGAAGGGQQDLQQLLMKFLPMLMAVG